MIPHMGVEYRSGHYMEGSWKSQLLRFSVCLSACSEEGSCKRGHGLLFGSFILSCERCDIQSIHMKRLKIEELGSANDDDSALSLRPSSIEFPQSDNGVETWRKRGTKSLKYKNQLDELSIHGETKSHFQPPVSFVNTISCNRPLQIVI